MKTVVLHVALGAGVAWWASTGVDPLICLAAYSLGLLMIKGPPRRA